jgi:hypothetical protein
MMRETREVNGTNASTKSKKKIKNFIRDKVEPDDKMQKLSKGD